MDKMESDMKSLKRISIAAILLQTSQFANADIATKAEEMASGDPYGLIMTLTSVCVVFAVLILLWLVYAFAGKIFSGGLCRKDSKAAKQGMTPETAAAIAMAIEKENKSEVNAAIALALHQYMNETVHDQESFVLTIRPTFGPFAARQFTLRQLPEKKN